MPDGDHQRHLNPAGRMVGILATRVNNFTIDNVKIDTNRDGMDIDSCRNVHISNCSVNSPFDDGICLKADYSLGFFRDVENVTITNCMVSGFDNGTFLDGTYQRKLFNKPNSNGPTGRIKFGRESSGGFKNITISNSVFDYCRGLALETVDGGHLENVTISNVTMREISNAPIFLRLGSRLRSPEGTPIAAVFKLDVNQTLTQKITLEVGSSSETITVNADAVGVMIQRASTELGTTIDEQAVHELPLNGRNFTQLLILQPGINPVDTAQGGNGVGSADGGNIAIPNSAIYKPSVNGAGNRSNAAIADRYNLVRSCSRRIGATVGAAAVPVGAVFCQNNSKAGFTCPTTPPTPAAINQKQYMPFADQGWNYSESTGYSNFNALEAQFQKRFSGGLETLVAFTWEKCLADTNGDFNAENGSEEAPYQYYFNPRLGYGPGQRCSTGVRCMNCRLAMENDG
jgi:hypothetical protein